MWSDNETLYDFLGYKTYVEVMADICAQTRLAPLTLGIFGPWGRGKTSLRSMLQRRLDSLLVSRLYGPPQRVGITFSAPSSHWISFTGGLDLDYFSAKISQ